MFSCYVSLYLMEELSKFIQNFPKMVHLMKARICVQECLMRLLSSKTVIYVTHQLEFIDAADLILVNFNFFITSSKLFGWLMTSQCMPFASGVNNSVNVVVVALI